MADPKHMKNLKKGVQHWNSWRSKNPELEPDLSEADLSYKDLKGINFTKVNLSNSKIFNARVRYAEFYRANLTKANLVYTSFLKSSLWNVNLQEADLQATNLEEADLRGANLFKANLFSSDLRRVNFRGADLRYANLHQTYLRGADLRESNLQHAIITNSTICDVNLCGANLHGVDLKKAHLGETIIGNTDLSEAKNLDSCIHDGPSTIDHRTILKSGTIHLNFLRGCGLPDQMIEYLPPVNDEMDFYQYFSCFISYSNKDETIANKIFNDLQDNGIRCWFAPKSLRVGDKIRDNIDDAIENYDKLLIILSKNSIESQWVEDEVDSAFEKENKTNNIVLFPIMIDSAVMDTQKSWAAKIRRSRNICDLTNWGNSVGYKNSLKILIEALKQ